jgi:putative phosphoribosyl transferase
LMRARFADRRAAGRELAQQLSRYAQRRDLVVLGLARGGVPVAYEVAQALEAPLDVFVVRKLGVPGREELAMGAIGPGGMRVLNRDVIAMVGIEERQLEGVTEREHRELERRERIYRGYREAIAPVDGHSAIVVDDGLATGATMRAAIRALREHRAEEITVAVPVASMQTYAEVGELADHIVCACMPEPFMAVGIWYSDFRPTTDAEVRELLACARATATAGR